MIKSEPRLFVYIRQFRDGGHTDKEIERLLSQKGYTDKDIKEALQDFNQASDIHNEDQLVRYFNEHIRGGFHLEQLIQHAINQGVDQHLIQRAVLRVDLPTPQEKEPEPDISQDEEFELHFCWKDPIIIIFICLSIGLTFIAPVFAFVAVILSTLVLLRILHISSYPLATIALIFAFGFAILGIFIPYAFYAAGMFVLNAILYYLP